MGGNNHLICSFLLFSVLILHSFQITIGKGLPRHMMLLFLLIIFLPLLEIIGFIVIGGQIGVGLSLLWVIADVIIGSMLLATMGGRTLQKAKKSAATETYPFEEVFDGFCIMIGALLLIFPGFISDVLALPLLIPPVRHWIFLFLKHKHNNVFNDLSKSSQGFTTWYYEESPDGTTIKEFRGGSTIKTIEGEFRSPADDSKKLQ